MQSVPCFSNSNAFTDNSKTSEGSDSFRSPIVPQRFRLMLIDDDIDQLSLFKCLLEIEGFKVLAASSAEEAIALMKQHKIDLVISDLRMPSLDGRDMVRYLRGLNPFRAASKIPIIILSCSDKSVELDLLKLGAEMYCAKEEASRLLIPQINLLLSQASIEESQ